MNIEKLKDFEGKLNELSERHIEAAEQYQVARVRHSELKGKFLRMQAEIFVKYKGTKGYGNMGKDQCTLIMLQDAAKTDHALFDEYQEYLTAEALYKALDRKLEHFQGDKIALQTLMKWTLSGEMYGPTT